MKVGVTDTFYRAVKARPGWALHCCAVWVLVALFSVASVQPTYAFELFGIHLFGKKKEEKEDDSFAVLNPQNYAASLSVSGGDEGLEQSIERASRLMVLQNTPPSGTAGLLQRAYSDLERILAVLYRQAYYGGSIDIRIDGQRLDDVSPAAELPATAAVTIIVVTGPQFTFGNVTIDSPLIPGGGVDDAKSLKLIRGKPAFSGTVIQAEAMLISRWRSRGYPLAKIAKRDLVAEHATATLNVLIVVDPGMAADFGTVSVTGEDRMNGDFIIWMTGIEPGTSYDPEAIDLAYDRLRRLQVFRSVRIIEADALTPPNLLPITVTVDERKPRTFGGGVTWSSLDGAGAEAFWTHRNLFGRAERLTIQGSVGGVGSHTSSGLQYNLLTRFTRPGVFTPDTDFVAEARGSREEFDAYNETQARAKAGFNHQFNKALSASIFGLASWSRTTDAFGTREFVIGGIPTELVYDTRNDPLDPTSGIHATIFAQPFYEFENENFVLHTNAQVATYYAFDEDGRYVIAGRVRVGSDVGAPIDELPGDLRFLAGGGGSVRGYPYQSLGPIGPDGDVVAGRSLFDGSLELRMKVTEKIGVVPFVDVGNAFASEFPDFSDSLRVGAGLGLRYYTPIGPIRVDAAVPLNRQPGGPDFGVYLGIGQSF